MKVIGFDHIAIQTSHLDNAIEFYVDILGAELITRRKFKRRQMAWLRFGQTKIELFSKRDRETLLQWSDFYSGPVHISLLVEDLETFLKHVLAKGAEFHPSHPEPFTPPVKGAGMIAYLRGPDGEEVELRSLDDTGAE